MPERVTTLTLIQPGDAVAYSQTYLDRQNVNAANLIYARGEVTAIHRIANDVLLADVDWDTAGLPKRVYAKDIVKV